MTNTLRDWPIYTATTQQHCGCTFDGIRWWRCTNHTDQPR